MGKKLGRPTIYDEAIADEVLSRMAAGETLTKICEPESYPDANTFRVWAIKDEPPGFAGRYARAREMQASAFFDRAILKSEEQGDWQSLRLQVDTLKWAAAKLYPRAYGDKIQNEHSGAIDFRPKSIGRRENLEHGDGSGS